MAVNSVIQIYNKYFMYLCSRKFSLCFALKYRKCLSFIVMVIFFSKQEMPLHLQFFLQFYYFIYSTDTVLNLLCVWPLTLTTLD